MGQEKKKELFNNGKIDFGYAPKYYYFTHIRFVVLDDDIKNDYRKHKLRKNLKVDKDTQLFADSGAISIFVDYLKEVYKARIILLGQQGQMSAIHSDWVEKEEVGSIEATIRNLKREKQKEIDFWNKKISKYEDMLKNNPEKKLMFAGL